MSDTTERVRAYLASAGFEIAPAHTPFSFAAQNAVSIVFVAPSGSDIELAKHKVLDVLSAPFRSKRFGPKTMEMYCVFVSEQSAPLTLIEHCEQDIRICRKIVVTNEAEIDERLSFLRPLDEDTTGSLGTEETFWTNLGKRLSADEIAFLREVEKGSASTETVVNLVRMRR